jgi:outer membrane protein TolC
MQRVLKVLFTVPLDYSRVQNLARKLRSMIRKLSSPVAVLMLAMVAATGCTPTQPFFFHEDGDLSHWVGHAGGIESPSVNTTSLAEVTQARDPFLISRPEDVTPWELALEDCVQTALQNTKVIRAGGVPRLQSGVITPGSGEGLLMTSILSAATIYDGAITRTEVGAAGDGRIFEGNVGEDVALATFDAQFSLFAGGSPNSQGAIYDGSDIPNNTAGTTGFFPAVTLGNSSSVIATLDKNTASGTALTFRSSTSYDGTNAGARSLDTFWRQSFDIEATHPLMRGRGVLVNRMPLILARMRTDDELANIEAQVQRMIANIEIRYWDLHCAYRQLETAKIGMDSALVTWKIVNEKYVKGVETIQAEAQSRGQYFAFRSQVEESLRDLYDTEAELRLTMGLTPTDNRLIRPSDIPTLAKVDFEWREIRTESLARRPELRRQRWQLKRRENELILAKNSLLPQLNVFAQYRWQGAGDDLINADRNGLDLPTAGSTAFDELFEGNYQEFFFGFDFIPPAFGARAELAGVRNTTLKMARDKARLEDMELDAVAGLSKSMRNLDATYQLAKTRLNQAAAAGKEVESAEALYRGGKITLDRVLEAYQRRAQAQLGYYQSVCEYNKSIADIHLRKGSILEYSNIMFEEGPWPEKAYWDAMEKARERDASYYLDYGVTRPAVQSRGDDSHGSGGFGQPGHVIQDGQILEGTFQDEVIIDQEIEMIPTPAQPNELNLGSEPQASYKWGGLGMEKPAPVVASSESDDNRYAWGDLKLNSAETKGRVQPAGFEQ